MSPGMLRRDISRRFIITGCAGDGNFRPPQNKHPLTDHQKNWYRWLRRRPLRLRQIWCKSVDEGLLGKWVKYNEILFIYLFITFFSSTHLQVRPVDGFSRLMAQTTRICERMCLLGDLLTLLPILGVKYPQNPNFGAWIGVFKPNGQNIESFMLSKLRHRFQPNFAQR